MTRELDRAVAEALGYHVRSCEARFPSVTRRLFELVGSGGELAAPYISVTEEEAWGYVPRFSADIAEAWKLIPLLWDVGYDVSIYAIAKDRGYGVTVGEPEETMVSLAAVTDADTAPRAICEAFLKVRGVKP